MRKHLIGTILVLAALAACNKEVETPAPAVDNGQEEVTPGMVTMTFTAAMGEETRTAYPDDKTGKWVVGDQITVCVTKDVTDGEQRDYKLYNFTATRMSGELMEFSGSVKDGYTTIVSGIYPVSNKTVLDDGEVVSNHVFSNGVVESVYLPESYNLGDENDDGSFIPMVGKIENDAFTFHHICGALKITVVDIFNALTFTTAGEKIAGLFSLNSDGHIALNTAAETATDNVTFNYDRLSTNPTVGDRNNRTFFIPVPDGIISGGATMELKNGNKVVFEKKTSANNSIRFNGNVIKRLPVIKFNVWDNCSITINKSGTTPDITYDVDGSLHYIRQLISLQDYNANCGGNVAGLIEKYFPVNNGQTGLTTYNTSHNAQYYYDNGPLYKSFIIGVNQVDKTGRLITFDIYSQDFIFSDLTNQYNSWLGKWKLSNSDTWTITEKESGTYSVTGLCGRSFSVEAQITGEGNLSFQTLVGFGTTTTSSGYQASLNLYRRKTETGGYVPGKDIDLMMAHQSENDENSASLSYYDSNHPYYTIIGTYTNDQGESKAVGYGTRSASATMTRVTSTE